MNHNTLRSVAEPMHLDLNVRARRLPPSGKVITDSELNALAELPEPHRSRWMRARIVAWKAKRKSMAVVP